MLTPEEFVDGFLSHMVPDTTYDPQKAHEYYMRTRQLKGRQPASIKPATSPAKSKGTSSVNKVTVSVSAKRQQEVNSRVASLQKRLGELESLLQDLLSKAKKKDSGQSTAKQKQSSAKSSKEYYQKHKSEIASKAKADYVKNPDSNLSIEEVRAKISTIRVQLKTAIANARQQLSKSQTVKSR